MSEILTAGTGVASVALFALLLALGMYWMLFPWFVYRKLDVIIRELRAGNNSAKPATVVAPPLNPRPPPPGTESYHVYHGGEVLGPYPRAQLEELLRKGTLGPEEWVIAEGAAQWIRARAALAE